MASGHMSCHLPLPLPACVTLSKPFPPLGLRFLILQGKEILTLTLANLRPQHGEETPIPLQNFPPPSPSPFHSQGASGCFYTEKLILSFNLS